MRARKNSEHQRLELAIPRKVADDRLRADLGGRHTEAMTSLTDPVLGQLWNNRRDAAYDQL